MSKAPTYSEKDISVLDNPVALIRKSPNKFVREDPTGAYFASRLVEDLILLDVGPLRVARSGSWYSVAADRDWLASASGFVSLEPFVRMIPMPSGGMFYIRTEVILNALADAVVTSGIDGIAWISGELTHGMLPNDFDISLSSRKGRIVAFHFSRSSAA